MCVQWPTGVIARHAQRMLWLLAAVDAAAAGIYLLAHAYRRESRDKPGVLSVGVTLLVCTVLLTGLALWQTRQVTPDPGTPSVLL